MSISSAYCRKTKMKRRQKFQFRVFAMLTLLLLFFLGSLVAKSRKRMGIDIRALLLSRDGDLEKQRGYYYDNGMSQQQQHRELDECSEENFSTTTPLLFTFYLLSLIYMFLASESLCDDYFLPALEDMADAEHLNLTPDVAGATLMAVGGSASELFTNLFATLKKSDVGVGTIIGSAVFNVLVVIAACCLLTTSLYHHPLQLTPWPILRDFAFYCIGLIVLAIVMSNGNISIGESLLLFSLYFLYVLLMYFNERLSASYEAYMGVFDSQNEIITDLADELDLEMVITSEEEEASPKKSIKTTNRIGQLYEQVPLEVESDLNEDSNDANDDDDDSQTFISFIKWILLFPLQVCLRYTIPTKTTQVCYLELLSSSIPHHICYVQFCLSIVWIGIFSDYTVFCAEVIGSYVGVPPVIMGLTLVSAGSSVQDLISSVMVARRGEGDMAISSTIGSNIFDILVCLLLPWILYLLLHRNQTDSVMVASKGILVSIPLLLATNVLTVFAMYLEKWKLTKRLGWMMLGSYFVFISISIFVEMPFPAGCTK